MNEITIAVKYDNDNPTVSGRELHAALMIDTPYHKWFPRMCEYGFAEGIDFNSDKNVRVQIEGSRSVSREVTDHQLTIDNVTANYYSHLEYSSRIESADKIARLLSGERLDGRNGGTDTPEMTQNAT